MPLKFRCKTDSQIVSCAFEIVRWFSICEQKDYLEILKSCFKKIFESKSNNQLVYILNQKIELWNLNKLLWNKMKKKIKIKYKLQGKFINLKVIGKSQI